MEATKEIFQELEQKLDDTTNQIPVIIQILKQRKILDSSKAERNRVCEKELAELEILQQDTPQEDIPEVNELMAAYKTVLESDERLKTMYKERLTKTLRTLEEIEQEWDMNEKIFDAHLTTEDRVKGLYLSTQVNDTVFEFLMRLRGLVKEGTIDIDENLVGTVIDSTKESYEIAKERLTPEEQKKYQKEINEMEEIVKGIVVIPDEAKLRNCARMNAIQVLLDSSRILDYHKEEERKRLTEEIKGFNGDFSMRETNALFARLTPDKLNADTDLDYFMPNHTGLKAILSNELSRQEDEPLKIIIYTKNPEEFRRTYSIPEEIEITSHLDSEKVRGMHVFYAHQNAMKDLTIPHHESALERITTHITKEVKEATAEIREGIISGVIDYVCGFLEKGTDGRNIHLEALLYFIKAGNDIVKAGGEDHHNVLSSIIPEEAILHAYKKREVSYREGERVPVREVDQEGNIIRSEREIPPNVIKYITAQSKPLVRQVLEKIYPVLQDDHFLESIRRYKTEGDDQVLEAKIREGLEGLDVLKDMSMGTADEQEVVYRIAVEAMAEIHGLACEALKQGPKMYELLLETSTLPERAVKCLEKKYNIKA